MSRKRNMKKGVVKPGTTIASREAANNKVGVPRSTHDHNPTVTLDKVTYPSSGGDPYEPDTVQHNETVKVPDVLNPKNRSYAPSVGYTPGSWKRGEAGKTMASGPRTTLFIDKPREADMPKQQSTMKPPKPPMIARKADPSQEQFQKETEKMHRRVQGAASGKRAAARARIAAFGKGGEAALRGKDARATMHDSLWRHGLKKITETHLSAHVEEGTGKLVSKNPHRSKGYKVLRAKDPAKKSLLVMSIADYHSEMKKAEAEAPPVSGGGAAAPAKKFPRKVKPMTKMKPTSDQSAVDKSLLLKLQAIKALVTGYGKVSGGGALRAPNRGPLMLNLDEDDDIDKSLRWSHKKEGHATTSHGKYHVGTHTDASGKTHHVVTYTHKETGRTFQSKHASRREALGALTEHHLKNRPPPKPRKPREKKEPKKEQKLLTARAGAHPHCPPCP